MSSKMQDTAKGMHYLSFYRNMITAREIDALEQEFTKRGEAFFHVSGAGHEGTVTLAAHLTPDDWLHCHYRDKALMLARGISPYMFFLSLFCKDESHSRGRQMSAHLSAPELKVLSLVGPVGNSALQSAGIAETVKEDPSNPVVLCSLGDGMSQQGEVLEAIAHTVRDGLPVLFLVQDNTFAISTKTGGRTFYSQPDGPADSFYGIPITRIDGCDIETSYETFGSIVETMRKDRKPHIVVYEVERLSNHTNADDQRIYRSDEEIARVCASSDPILSMRKVLVENGVEEAELDAMREETVRTLREEAKRAQRSRDPEPVFTAKKELPPRLTDRKAEYRGAENERNLVMIEAIRETLRHRMGADEKVVLFGEDIEDPKGDVFGVTRGLTKQYPGRVVNSPLSESTILGVSIGRALAGDRPVAFLQFADFLPLAYNQIFAELGSMYWRTDGSWQVPLIVMITCGGYKPGLGPFHASSLEALGVHTPGVDVFMPSNAADAAGMLNAAFESGRPTLFFYPKNCLNDRANGTSKDISAHFVPVGKARLVREGKDITLVGWGNTVSLCLKAADTLEAEGFSSDVIDLRSLSPWDEETVIASAEKTGMLIVVHEDNHSSGMGSEVLATVGEKARSHVRMKRVTRADTYVPCNFENQLEVLPSYKRVLETSADLLGLDITWVKENKREKNVFLVEAIGSSPSDESVTVLEWHVKEGDEISSGMLLASLEADKAVQELMSPVDGYLLEVLVPEGDMVKVGTPLLKVKTDESDEPVKPITQENPGDPFFRKRPGAAGASGATVPSVQSSHTSLHKASGDLSAQSGSPLSAPQAKPGRNDGHRSRPIGISSVSVRTGSRVVGNGEIIKTCTEWTEDGILKRTGIESRYWVDEGEDALSLAVDASRGLLAQENLSIDDIDMIICSTGTPVSITPSMACLIQHRLSDEGAPIAQALDVNAACSGYLYALQNAYDHLLHYPGHNVLVVTTETLSRRTDPADPATAPIFGDAATATLVTDAPEKVQARLFRPVLSAQGENGSILSVPLEPEGRVFMDGPKVFLEAIKDMILMLNKAGEEAGLQLSDIDLIVPHQANQRIINAIRQKLGVPREKVFSNIRTYGNTSSSSIPIALEKLLGNRTAGERFGLCAFGGGFTFGGAILELI